MNGSQFLQQLRDMLKALRDSEGPQDAFTLDAEQLLDLIGQVRDELEAAHHELADAMIDYIDDHRGD